MSNVRPNFLNRLIDYTILAALFFLPLIFTPGLLSPPGTYLVFELPKTIFFQTVTLVLLFLFIIKIITEQKIEYPVLRKREKVVFTLLAVFWLVLCLSTLFSIDPSLSFWGSYYRMQGLFNLLHILIFSIITFYSLKNQEQVRKIFNTLLISGVLVSIYGVMQQAGLDFISIWDKDAFLGRIFSSLGQPNFLGQYLILIIFPTISLILLKKRPIVPIFILVLLFFALLFTLSRSAFLGLIVGTIFFFVIFAKTKEKKLLFRSLILFTLLPILFVGAINFFGESNYIKNNRYLNRVIITGENLRSIQSRFHIWPNTLKIIKKYPLFGSGLETFQLTFPSVQPKELLALERFTESADRAHNEVLDLAVSSGIIGVISYLSFIFYLLYLSLKFIKKYRRYSDSLIVLGLLSALVASFITNQFGFPTKVHLVLSWVYIAIILKMITWEKDQKEFTFKGSRKIYIPVICSSLLLLGGSIYVHNIRSLQADLAFKEGQIYFMSDLNSAQNKYEKANNLNPHQSFYAYHLADLLVKRIEIINDILNNKNFKKTERLKQETKQKNLFLKTEKVLLKAENFTSNDYVGTLLKARLYSLWGKSLNPDKTAEALITFNKAGELAPNSPEIWKEWGNALYYAGLPDKALEKYQHFLDISPNYWEWKKDLAQKSDSQKELYRIFYKQNPFFNEIFLFISRSYFKTGDFKKSLKYLTYADNNIHTLSTYAVVYGYTGNYSLALEYFQKALNLDPQNKELRRNIEEVKNKIKKI